MKVLAMVVVVMIRVKGGSNGGGDNIKRATCSGTQVLSGKGDGGDEGSEVHQDALKVGGPHHAFLPCWPLLIVSFLSSAFLLLLSSLSLSSVFYLSSILLFK